MSVGGVTLLRSAALRCTGTFTAGLVLAAPITTAAASPGGAPLPASEHATASAPAAAPLPGGEPTPSAAATQPAAQVALTPPLPALPALATQSRRPSDPATSDLAALIEPSPIAAVDGHVVYVRQHMGRTELVDVADPSRPRVLLSGTREFGVPSAGRDAAGRPVVVVSPCAGTEEVLMMGQAPRCPLRAVDLVDGTSRALPATTGAMSGDLAGDRLVFTRRSGSAGTHLYASEGGSARAVTLPRLGRTGDGWLPSHGVPKPGTIRIAGLDASADGRIAAVIEYRSKTPAHSSSLWLRSASGEWRRVTTLGTSFAGLGTRHVLAPALDDGGVRAYVEGIVETPSFVARWSDAGALTTKLSLRRSIGRTTILHGAAYDGDRLLFVDWLPGVPCGSEDALACGLRAAAPITIR
ncbi:MAG: hypothetical protein JHD16_13455 [Solirubrobacteraceae bacterium]|nr:hypothetical protein [Solirubrobacteraceae bacterium]